MFTFGHRCWPTLVKTAVDVYLEVEAGEIWAGSRCLPAVTVMQRGIYAHLSSVGIMRKTAPKTGRRTWRSEENREVWGENRSETENIISLAKHALDGGNFLGKKFRIISRGAKPS